MDAFVLLPSGEDALVLNIEREASLPSLQKSTLVADRTLVSLEPMKQNQLADDRPEHVGAAIHQ